MEIRKEKNESSLTLWLIGRLDTTTAPQFEAEVADLSGVIDLILDFERLDYVSSAGLRVLLITEKKMSQQGRMVVKNVCSDVMDLFEITGFSEILNIE